MDWIEAALAFAVVMMLMSTAVTVVMEAAYNLLRIREQGLRRLVESVYENIVVPRLPPMADGATAAGFVDTLTSARYLPVTNDPGKGNASWLKRLVSRTVNAAQRKELSTLEFVERLAETPAGRRLFEESERRGGEYLDIFLGDLAVKFEDFSRSASEYFARRAKLTSTVIAIGLAFSLNVNAVYMYESLLRDGNLRDSLISQGEQVAASMQDAEDRLAAVLAGEGDSAISKEELDERIAELQSIVSSMERSGLPIGWRFPPWERDGGAAGQAPGGVAYPTWLLFIGWLLSVTLAGLLIGLGGPFWFNVFRKLGALAGMARGAQASGQKDRESAAAESDDDSRIVIQVFLRAAKAIALAERDRTAPAAPAGADAGGPDS